MPVDAPKLIDVKRQPRVAHLAIAGNVVVEPVFKLRLGAEVKRIDR
jgi:hypothetical protein